MDCREQGTQKFRDLKLSTPYSLLPTPYSLLPIPYSLFPVPFAI
ncbi:hypothetical protein [Moorena sp. SIO4G3]|nr:hypothetical protein [Moorena sp. SIO4G3]